jgi:uncharacterized membrane protein
MSDQGDDDVTDVFIGAARLTRVLAAYRCRQRVQRVDARHVLNRPSWICHTVDVTELPSRTVYHRWLGWYAADLRRAVVVAGVGVVVAVSVLSAIGWALACVVGWDAAASSFLLVTWLIIARADGPQTRELAVREDPTRSTARLLLLGASVASLLGVGEALVLAGRASGTVRVLLVAVAVVTVVLSWALINTTYTLRYAHLQYARTDAAIDIEETGALSVAPYRDFAYVAFTIGMCYQVSDTTLRDAGTRGTALAHALLSYLFGVVIVAGAINLIAGLIR